MIPLGNPSHAVGLGQAVYCVIGTPSYFEGPMAKQHRMAIITVACMLSVFEDVFWPSGTVLLIALVVICIGCVITICRRARLSYQFLEKTGE